MFTRKISGDRQLLKMPLHIGATIEAGNTWDRRTDMAFDDLIYSGSVFLGLDTPMGPMFLGYGQTNQDDSAFYLHFGSLLFD